MFENHFLNWFQLLADMPFSVFSKASDNVPEVSFYMKSNGKCHQPPLIWLMFGMEVCIYMRNLRTKVQEKTPGRS